MGELLQKNKRPFGVYEAALASLLFIIFNFVFLQIYYLLPVSFRANEIVYYLACILLEGMFALTALTVAGVRKINLAEQAGMKKKVNGKIVFYCFLVALVSILGFSNLTNVFLAFLEKLGYSSVLSDTVIDNFGTYFAYIIVSCVTPAIFEELLFRGVIASGLKERGFKAALFVSAIIFTLMHGNAEQTVHQFIIGLVIGYLFLMTGNLWLGVLVHFFNNFISITVSYLYTVALSGVESLEVTAEVVSTSYTWLEIFGSLIFAVIYAVIAFFILRSLFRVILQEDKNLNSGLDARAEEVSSEVLIDGQKIETNLVVKPAQTDENANQNIDQNSSDEILTESQPNLGTKSKRAVTISTIVFFALSFSYLILDWVLALLQGFGVY